MNDTPARYWLGRFTPGHANTAHAAAFSADLARIEEALAQGHTLATTDSPPDGILRIHADAALQGAHAPLVVMDDKLWLYRTFQAEAGLARRLLLRLNHPPLPEPACPASRLDGLLPAQRRAVHHALTHRLTLINGGPGTGKTHTLARIVAILRTLSPELRIALAAPTGKAAKRMSESFAKATGQTLNALTVHRLLGITRTPVPQHNAEHPLPYDLVIIDEASMLSLELAHHLLAALAPDTRLILIGDAAQLAAVEPGAVLHDLCRHPLLESHTVTLTDGQRYTQDSPIGRLAHSVLHGGAMAPLIAQHPELIWHYSAADTHNRLFAPWQDYILALQNHADPDTCLAAFNEYRILCAGHHGALGTVSLNRAMRLAHLRALGISATQHWYPGKPVMITENDHANRLYNGDIGLCLGTGRALQLHFPDRDPLPVERISPAQLQDAYAMTVHKSQGSEYTHIALALDHSSFAHLSRELLYTGITRARKHITLYSAALPDAAPTIRSTGLGILLDRLHHTAK